MIDPIVRWSTDHESVTRPAYRRVLPASDIVSLLTGMKMIAVATVTARAEPRHQRGRRALPARDLDLEHQRSRADQPGV